MNHFANGARICANSRPSCYTLSCRHYDASDSSCKDLHSKRADSTHGSRQHLEQRIARLKRLLGRLVWPATDHIVAFGCRHALPLRLNRQPVIMRGSIEQSLLEYAVGFFDGDGCVTTYGTCHQCTLSVGQSACHAEVLMLFVHIFGGGIYKRGHGRGSSMPVAQWQLAGKESVSLAARILSQHASLKKPQLELAASWPKCREQRLEAKAALKEQKSLVPSQENLHCTWPYLAGFFDAEGCVVLSATSRQVKLTLSQKEPAVLEATQSFLRREFPNHKSCLCKGPGGWSLSFSDSSMQVLRRCLASGVIVKKSAAEAALSLGFCSHADVRERLHSLSGNQNRFRHLDESGCVRATQIHRAQAALRSIRRREAPKHVIDTAKTRIEELQRCHATLNRCTELSRVRSSIRALLKQGCKVVLKR
eukprot:TRINITY_DN34093_c0_g1_i1.p1 TRINITY_DN34093_c0_g1~~TRINITY_DN34093_c0_g1_i1.p1  ORF type:complete len:421 (-),score=46.34 TRINITY_DN34093_c0_g1_i1:350-1612(-)